MLLSTSWVATDDHVRKALLKLKAGKAADAGGWTSQALWAVARLPRCRSEDLTSYTCTVVRKNGGTAKLRLS